jgi:hypothetical protein
VHSSVSKQYFSILWAVNFVLYSHKCACSLNYLTLNVIQLNVGDESYLLLVTFTFNGISFHDRFLCLNWKIILVICFGSII